MKRITKTLVIALVALAAVAALAACASDNASSGSSSAPSAFSSTGASSASLGQIDAVGAEGVICIPLDYSAGTGYEWTYAAEPEGVLWFSSQVTESLSDEKGIAGGPLRDTFTFHAQTPGEVVLTFTLARSWEEGDEPADTQVYVFTVTDDLQIILNPYKSRFDNGPIQGANS